MSLALGLHIRDTLILGNVRSASEISPPEKSHWAAQKIYIYLKIVENKGNCIDDDACQFLCVSISNIILCHAITSLRD